MKLKEFDFALPERLIAQCPLPRRDQSRMMVLHRSTGKKEHRTFEELPDVLGPGHFLALNNTRVFPARLRARRPGKNEQIEVLLVREISKGDWLALLKPARKAKLGQELHFQGLEARVVDEQESGARVLRFESGDGLMDVFERIGEPPLPPYIHRQDNRQLSEDRIRYQTVYARHTGSVAAPTAGLHFTDEVLRRAEDRGIGRCEILLHVGYGTFQPVRCDEISEHRMEPEYFEVSERSANYILRNRAEGRSLIAVGSTTTRVLEHLAAIDFAFDRQISGFCDLFIYPGFQFRVLAGMLTNFHLPRSTLFMLVCAFAGRETMLECYREAIAEGYRFFSYGDCMLIL